MRPDPKTLTDDELMAHIRDMQRASARNMREVDAELAVGARARPRADGGAAMKVYTFRADITFAAEDDAAAQVVIADVENMFRHSADLTLIADDAPWFVRDDDSEGDD